MIGKILQVMRNNKGLTQKELASKLNIGQTTLSGYETEFRNIDFATIEKIAKECRYEVIFRNIDTKEELTSKNVKRKDI